MSQLVMTNSDANGEHTLDALVRLSRAGDRQALERLIEAIQGKVYNLAIRMLRVPADAEDATQEILIKVITHLGEFRSESAFTTWVYRVASNHLLDASQKNTKTPQAARIGLCPRAQWD